MAAGRGRWEAVAAGEQALLAIRGADGARQGMDMGLSVAGTAKTMDDYGAGWPRLLALGVSPVVGVRSLAGPRRGARVGAFEGFVGVEELARRKADTTAAEAAAEAARRRGRKAPP